LRGKISYLDQEAFLFEGTIEDNIVGSCPVRDHDRVVHAARLAGAEAFILLMKDGYETRVRELASNLSGGQKQRIGMARALYKDAPILLLDEPTSALDSASERHIRKALSTLTRARTTVIVAHRLSTVKNADLIYVIAEGGVLESGTHDELMARGGYYAAQLRTHLLDDSEDGFDRISAAGGSAE
jgi:ATP-binding cassette subfamily B protein